MRIFLDSGNVDDIQKAINSFQIEGITTNPKLTSVTGAKQIMRKFKLPTSIQPDINDLDEFYRVAQELDAEPLSVIKVPISYPHVIKALSAKSVQINCTLCFTMSQVITAVNLRAEYVSIFVGRMLDNGLDAYKLIKDAVTYISMNGAKTKVIAASIRNLEQFEGCARNSAHVVTLAPKLLLEAPHHPLTKAGEKDFWKNAT